MDSVETNTCLGVRAQASPFPRASSWGRPLGLQPGCPPPGWELPHWCHMWLGRAVPCPRWTGGQSRPQSGRAARPGHQPQGDGAALLCPAEGLPGTEPPELEHGHPSPAGRPRSARPAGWEQERDKEGQPLGHWTPTTGAHPSDPRGEAESSLLMLPPSGMPWWTREPLEESGLDSTTVKCPGSDQTSLHTLLGVRAWAGCPASLSLSVYVCWTGIAVDWTSPGDEMTDSESTCPAHRVSCTLLPTIIKLASRKSNIYGSDSVISYKKTLSGNSMVVQRLRLGTFTARTLVWSLVGELRSHKLCSTAKNISTEIFKNNK